MAIPTYIPLIISIVALVLPSLNTLKVFFETAEGYKKCSEAVIGPWSKLRWRRWSWSEFRFETHFVTPKIVLHNISEERLKQDAYKARYLALHKRRPGYQAGDRKSGSGRRERQLGLWRYLPWHWRMFTSVKCADALLLSGAILDAGLTHDFDTRSTQLSPGLVETFDEEKHPGMLPREQDIHFTSEQRVSWLTFLRHLFKIEHTALPSYAPSLKSTEQAALETDLLAMLHVDP